ncbi:hypothetical protein D3C80_845910 [compost metagenome]
MVLAEGADLFGILAVALIQLAHGLGQLQLEGAEFGLLGDGILVAVQIEAAGQPQGQQYGNATEDDAGATLLVADGLVLGLVVVGRGGRSTRLDFLLFSHSIFLSSRAATRAWLDAPWAITIRVKPAPSAISATRGLGTTSRRS